jgi:ubiquinone/menaquinone biosynthesis C-methylase UbiE
MPSTDYPAKSAYRGETAACYDQDRVGEAIWQQEQGWVAHWAATLPAGATVLDLPAGTGRFLEILLGCGLRVQAVDISTDMLAEIRKRHPQLPAALTLATGDAEQLPVPDASVDFVLSWRFFHLLPLSVIDRVLAEFRRVCRRQIVVQVLPARVGGVVACLPSWLRAIMRPVHRWVAGDSQASAATPWSHIASFTHVERDLLRAFARQRLTVVQRYELAHYQGHPVLVYVLAREEAS